MNPVFGHGTRRTHQRLASPAKARNGIAMGGACRSSRRLLWIGCDGLYGVVAVGFGVLFGVVGA